ncbi:uncharacterized protein FTJAE_3045 [Fusarium tjaetaba]|uniref:Uncharacterized protein n=1 Tax=Fusarium tjaetaba TaxID=1567544 RepID=A0A8H5S408_9HYPO|nr:uncharacterized protein FTJAE_3045 [Fusarium tjaetaba]KAF5643747.1 hypothetical protein FTJAE_3045 [Fusarium tjaetaba]
MASREVKERALLDRIEELEAELREMKARYAALETKARGDAKKLADIASIIQNGLPGNCGASDADTGRLESSAVASAHLDDDGESEATTFPIVQMPDGYEEVASKTISARLMDIDSDEIWEASTTSGAGTDDNEDEPKGTAN